MSKKLVVPDYIEPVEGWRGWKLEPDGKLHSVYYDAIWEPLEPFNAICLREFTNLTVSLLDKKDGTHLWSQMISAATQADTIQINYDIAGESNTATISELTSGISISYSEKWPTNIVIEAVHNPVSHKTTIEKNCSCGIYAVDDLKNVPLGCNVLGKVYGWGHVIKGVKGWRAEHAYPKELYCHPNDIPTLKKFGVPVKNYEPILNARF